jgi:hypothetical protein
MIDEALMHQLPQAEASGWVERPTRAFPQIRVVHGWEPTGGSDQVGVGADGDELDPYLSPEEERRRIQRRYGWDPQRRLQELGNTWGQSPISGLIQTVGLPFEALGSGVKYAGGVIHGLEQGAIEGIGGRPLQGEERRVYHGPFEAQTIPRLQNLLDPAEATARYSAIMNPVTQFGVEMAAGSRGLGPIFRGAGALSRGAIDVGEQVPGLSRALQIAQQATDKPWQPIVENPRLGFLGQVGDVMRHPATSIGINAGLPIAAAATAFSQERDEYGNPLPLEARALSAGLAGLGGLGAGLTLTAGLRGTGRAFSSAAHVYEDLTRTTANERPLSPIEYGVRSMIAGAQRVARGGVGRTEYPPAYPGGYPSLIWDMWRMENTDRLAMLDTLEKRITKDIGRPLTTEESPLAQSRLISGVADRTKVFWHDAARLLDEYHIGAKQLKDFDALRLGQMADDRMRLSRKATGEKLTTRAETQAYLEDTRARINERYGEQTGYGDQTAAKWTEAMERLTQEVYNPVLTWAYKSGLNSKAGILEDLKQHQIWGAFRDLELRPDNPAVQSINLNNRVLPVATGRGRWHSTIHDTDVSFEHDLEHLQQVLTIGQQNMVGRSLERLRALSPEFAQSVMIDYDPRLRKGPGVPVGKGINQPAGWRAMTVFDAETLAGTPPMELATRGKLKGQLVPSLRADERTYLMPSWLHEPMMNMTKGQADLVTGAMARFLRPFHLGVTTLSLPFLLKNPPRDLLDATQNLADTGPLWHNMIGAWFDAATGLSGLDDWMTSHANHPLVKGLPDRIYQSLQNYAMPEGSQLRNFNLAGAGSARLVSQSRLDSGTLAEAGVRGAPRTGIAGVFDRMPGGILVTGIPDLLAAAATISETGTRLAVFRATQQAAREAHPGMTPGQINEIAALQARSATVDFSKGGNTMRLASMWFPLLNARIQGQLRSFEAAKEDPQGFAMRAGVSAAVPTIMTYAVNRTIFSDLYDKISQDEKDKNHILIFGSYHNDRGEELPLRLKIPKNDVDALISNPLEHFLDTMFHVRNHEQALAPGQRTERSDGQMWLTQLAHLLPLNINSNAEMDPSNLGMAALNMNPVGGTVAQLWANRDAFRGEPIIPDDKLLLPAQYRFDERTPQLSRAVSALLQRAGAPESLQVSLAPYRTAFMARNLGGTAAQMSLGAGDLLVGALNAGADAAGYPKIDFNPRTRDDLGLPPGTNPEYFRSQLDAVSLADLRPWYARVAPWLVGSAGGQQTVMAKVEQAMGADDREIWHQTRDLMGKYQQALQVIDRREHDMYDSAAQGNLSAAEVLDRGGKLDAQRQEAMEALRAAYPKALPTIRDRQAFIERLPGVPINAALAQAKADLPSGIDLDALVERYQHPQAQADLAGLSPLQIDQLRTTELTRLGNQYRVPVSMLRDYIAASVAGQQLPAIGIPDVHLEEIINEYRNPHDPQTGQLVNRALVSGDVMGDYRRYVVRQAAQEEGISERDLLTRIQARYLDADEQHPMAQSIERAFSLSAQVRDPTLFPQYVDNQGRPLGTPDDWRSWKVIQERAKEDRGLAQSQLVRDLNKAEDLGNVRRLTFLLSQPQYPDYARWFGIGRTMSPRTWEAFMVGEIPKYEDRPLASEALQRDGFLQLYHALPPQAPERQTLQQTYFRYRRLASPAWRAAILEEQATQGLETSYLRR